jgi:hypothetical protein
MKPLTFSWTDLHRLHDQLDSWRRRQTGRQRLPSELWEAAAKLAATHGVTRVARTLRLDFHRVRRECQQLPSSAPIGVAPPGFVELKLDPSPSSVGFAAGWVELSDGAHRRMRLHTGQDPAAWVALARAFWESAP